MPLFDRETKRLRAMHNELRSEVVGLRSKERRLAERLRRLAWVEAELAATKADTESHDHND